MAKCQQLFIWGNGVTKEVFFILFLCLFNFVIINTHAQIIQTKLGLSQNTRLYKKNREAKYHICN